MDTIEGLKQRIQELEGQLAQSESKSATLSQLLKEATAEFNHALEKISTSETNFRAIIDNAPEAIYILEQKTHRILDCNPYTVRWLGYSRRELLSKTVEQILEPEAKGVHENIVKARKTGFIRIQERRFRKKNGRLVDAEVTGMMIELQGKRCFVALARDITQRKTIESLLRYKELFENVIDPVFITQFHGTFLEINDVACDRLGYTRSELLEMAFQDLVRPSHLKILHRMGHKIHSGEMVRFELDIMTRGGTKIPFEFHSRLIDFQRKPAILSVGRDLSARKKIEERLIRNERLSAVGEMASGVAHNFNNLLQMILGAGEAALNKLGTGEIRKCRHAIKTLIEGCHRGTDIVNRIKEFTLASSDEFEKPKVFDLGNLVSEAIQLTKPLWSDPAQPRKYRLNISTRPGCLVTGNPSEMFEVLVNLIKNAIEAMPGGGSLAICSEMHRGKIHLSFSDTGQGISEENLQRIFQPFFTTKGRASSGLGLSSSYGIVKKHLGGMTVKSVPGKGSTFFINLPQADVTNEESCLQPCDEGGSAEARIKLLVIDDEKNILDMMALFFEDTAIDLHTANSAQLGLAALQAGRFDAILCDYGMDGMNGLEVAKAAREITRNAGKPKIPFLLYTGFDNHLKMDKLDSYGIDRVVKKPVPASELMRIVQEMVAEKTSACSLSLNEAC